MDYEQIVNISKDIFNMSRNSLIVNFRFMDEAISKLKVIQTTEISGMTTNGMEFAYNPYDLLKLYKKNRTEVTRTYLHSVFHCIFQHFYVNLTINRDYWDLAVDIAVENIINELNFDGVSSARTQNQNIEIAELKKHVKYVTAEHLYRYFVDESFNFDRIPKLNELFKRDNHDEWYRRETVHMESEYSEKNSLNSSNETSDNGETAGEEVDTYEEKKSEPSTEEHESNNEQKNCEIKNEKINSNNNFVNEYKNNNSFNLDGQMYKQLTEEWKSISHHIQMDMKAFSKLRGNIPSSMAQNLLEVTREKYDYTSFLKKFAVIGETMKINDDEFDYIFYTYGLNMYKNMPLVEPLEYKEVKRIKEFVVAIDTSGSTSGELVQSFLQKTYNILKQEESFFTKINLHIVQCDADIQEDAKITSQEEFDEYLKKMTIKGLGGTDFRPVFSYVDKLIENKEFTNLKGMIYFTDGFGVYPQKQPEYQTAVIYVDDGYNNPEVPVWVIKLVLKPEEI